MYISDDHIFFGSLSLAFVAFLIITFSFTEASSITNPATAPIVMTKNKASAETTAGHKKIKFRPTLNSRGSRTKHKIAHAILSAGFPCTHMTYIKPLALSGLYQATCMDQASNNIIINYIYNDKSGFIHQL